MTAPGILDGLVVPVDIGAVSEVPACGAGGAGAVSLVPAVGRGVVGVAGTSCGCGGEAVSLTPGPGCPATAVSLTPGFTGGFGFGRGFGLGGGVGFGAGGGTGVAALSPK